jgi:hypothetical protein
VIMLGRDFYFGRKGRGCLGRTLKKISGLPGTSPPSVNESRFPKLISLGTDLSLYILLEMIWRSWILETKYVGSCLNSRSENNRLSQVKKV